jgi:hypothetical protein
MVLYAYVLCLSILTSSRILDMILEDKLLISQVVLSHKVRVSLTSVVSSRQTLHFSGGSVT